jgi:hypothetical protein
MDDRIFHGQEAICFQPCPPIKNPHCNENTLGLTIKVIPRKLNIYFLLSCFLGGTVYIFLMLPFSGWIYKYGSPHGSQLWVPYCGHSERETF